MDYLYDDTFEGLLTCIYSHYYMEKATGIYSAASYQPSMLQGSLTVETEELKASKVYEAIENKISSLDLKRVYRTYLSAVPEKENKILNYVRLGFKVGPKLGSLHSNPIVFEVQKAEKKVSAEVHRLLGLVRFDVWTHRMESEAEILYAKIEPDHDVSELLAPHFSDRFAYQPFIIHDLSRHKALIAKGGDWYISSFTEEDMGEFKRDEMDFPLLWRTYFDTIAIKERTNPKCQKRCMPARYWKNLTEFQF